MYRKITSLAWPLIISNLSIPIVGLIDSALLGHLDDAIYLAAVSMGATLLAFIYWSFNFLRMGTTGITANAVGNANNQRLNNILIRAGTLALLISLLLLIFKQPLLNYGLAIMEGEQGVTSTAYNYCRIRFYSVPAVLLSYVLIGWFMGKQQPRIIMWLVFITAGSNVVLDIIFIHLLDLKSNGAAWATVIAEWLSALVAMYVAYRSIKKTASKRTPFKSLLLDMSEYRKLLLINQHLFIRTCCLLACFLFFTAQGAQQNNSILAANTILLQLALFAAYGLDGFAQAMESLVGERYGKQQLENINRVVNAGSLLSIACAAIYSIILFVLSPLIPLWFSDNSVVINYLHTYWPWLLMMPLFSVGAYILDGVFVGLLKTKTMQNTVLFSALVIYLPCFYLSQELEWSNHGLWLAFTLFSLSRSISLFWYYHKWKQSVANTTLTNTG